MRATSLGQSIDALIKTNNYTLTPGTTYIDGNKVEITQNAATGKYTVTVTSSVGNVEYQYTAVY